MAESRTARRVPARTSRAPARPRRLRLGLRRRSSRAAAEGREAARGVRPGARARDLPDRLERGGDRRASRRTRNPPRRSAAPRRRCPTSTGTPRPHDLLLEGVALVITDGHAAATPTLQRAAQALAEIPLEDVLRWGWMALAASALVWDFEGMLAISARQAQLVRDAGALYPLPSTLHVVGLARAWMGDFAGATSALTEAESVAAATGNRIAPYTLLRLRALQGREAEAAAPIARALEHAETQGQGLSATYAHWASAVLNNGLARYEEAASAARRATSNAIEPWHVMWALPELVEAAARAGDVELAVDALERLARTTQPAGNDLALGIEARCHALLSDRRGRPRAVSGSDPTAGSNETPAGARPRASALWRVAAPRGPTPRRARAVADRPRHVRHDRNGRVCGPHPP